MYNLYTPIISSGLLSSQGIQNINIFYNTLFLNMKTFDSDTNKYYNYLLIEKVNFDYTTSQYLVNNKNYIINFGNTNSQLPFSTSTGNCLVDNILLEKEKVVLVCGLSSLDNEKYIPTVFKYDINNNSLLRIYPKTNDIDQWKSIQLGTFLSAQNPLVSYNPETNILNYIFRTYTNSISGNESLIDIELLYSVNTLTINNMHILTAFGNSNFTSINFVKFKNYDDNKKIVFIRSNVGSIATLSLDYS